MLLVLYLLCVAQAAYFSETTTPQGEATRRFARFINTRPKYFIVFYQDRLGTDTREALKTEVVCVCFAQSTHNFCRQTHTNHRTESLVL